MRYLGANKASLVKSRGRGVRFWSRRTGIQIHPVLTCERHKEGTSLLRASVSSSSTQATTLLPLLGSKQRRFLTHGGHSAREALPLLNPSSGGGGGGLGRGDQPEKPQIAPRPGKLAGGLARRLISVRLCSISPLPWACGKGNTGRVQWIKAGPDAVLAAVTGCMLSGKSPEFAEPHNTNYKARGGNGVVVHHSETLAVRCQKRKKIRC